MSEEIIHTITEEEIKENGLEGELEAGEEVILPATEEAAEASAGEVDTEHESRLKVCVPLAQEILKIIGNNSTMLGDLTNEERTEHFKDINSQVLELLNNDTVKLADISFVFQLVFQAFDTVKGFVVNSVDKAYEMSVQKMFGKDKLDLTLVDIDNVLKS